MNLTILGTGNATVTHCYNTCFVLEEKGQYLLVDGGGGNGLLQQLEKAELRWQDMRTVFVTHKHIDHLLGIIWLMRMMCQSWRRGTYDGEARSTPTTKSSASCAPWRRPSSLPRTAATSMTSSI